MKGIADGQMSLFAVEQHRQFATQYVEIYRLARMIVWSRRLTLRLKRGDQAEKPAIGIFGSV